MLDLASLARSPARANEVMDTVLGAIALQVLVINLRLRDLYLPPDWQHEPCSRDEALRYTISPISAVGAGCLMDRYEFRRLFEMECLKRVIIKVEHGFFSHTPRSVCVMGGLAELLRAGFEAAPGVADAAVQHISARGISITMVSIARR